MSVSGESIMVLKLKGVQVDGKRAALVVCFTVNQIYLLTVFNLWALKLWHYHSAQMSGLYAAMLADIYANVSIWSLHVCTLADAESNF